MIPHLPLETIPGALEFMCYFFTMLGSFVSYLMLARG